MGPHLACRRHLLALISDKGLSVPRTPALPHSRLLAWPPLPLQCHLSSPGHRADRGRGGGAPSGGARGGAEVLLPWDPFLQHYCKAPRAPQAHRHTHSQPRPSLLRPSAQPPTCPHRAASQQASSTVKLGNPCSTASLRARRPCPVWGGSPTAPPSSLFCFDDFFLLLKKMEL